MKQRPTILTIAGFDPTGGAGVLADIKTFEALRCLGMAVQTANTVQTEDSFEAVNWLPQAQIMEQFNSLLGSYAFDGVKIGLIQSFGLLSEISTLIRTKNPKTKIIWDPVLSASAGFDFEHDLSDLETVLKSVDWITPNWNEAVKLSGNEDAMLGSTKLSEYAKVYLKGGHKSDDQGKDYLWEKGTVQVFNPKKGDFTEKHGSGCVFSAALTVNLCKGYPKQKAVLRAKRYVEFYLKSNKGLLGRHK